MKDSTLKIEVGPVQGTAMLKLITRYGVSTRLVNKGDTLELADGDGIVATLGVCLLHLPDGAIVKMKVPSQIIVTRTPQPNFFALPTLIWGEVWYILTTNPDDYLRTPDALIGVEG